MLQLDQAILKDGTLQFTDASLFRKLLEAVCPPKRKASQGGHCSWEAGDPAQGGAGDPAISCAQVSWEPLRGSLHCEDDPDRTPLSSVSEHVSVFLRGDLDN